MAKVGTNRHESARFSEKDESLALGLAQGLSRSDAATYAGVGLRTVFTRLKDPEFTALVVRFRDRLISEAFGKLAGAADPAVEAMKELIRSDDEGIRLQASKSLLMMLVKLGDWHDLARRVAELEERAKDPGDPARPRLIIPDHDDRWSIADRGDDREQP